MLVPAEAGVLLAELGRERLAHVVVGGVAVNLLGYERTTRDVDVLVPATEAQGRAIHGFLSRLGATRPDRSPLPDMLFDGQHHIRALTSLGIIDFIPEGGPPLSFKEVNDTARYDEVQEPSFGEPIWRISLRSSGWRAGPKISKISRYWPRPMGNYR